MRKPNKRWSYIPILLSIFILTFLNHNKSVAQNWELAKKAGGPGIDMAYYIHCDLSGSIYLTGSYEGDAEFDSDTLSSYGGRDCCLAKYGEDGTLLWVKHAGSMDDDFGGALFIDKNGDIILIGTCYGPAMFDFNSITTFGGSDIFIAKYDSDGNCLWVTHAGSYYDDVNGFVSYDGNEHFYFSAVIGSTATFDTITVPNPGGQLIHVVAKYTLDGHCESVYKIAGNNENVHIAGLSYNDSSLFITGQYNGSANFGSCTLSTSSPMPYITKFDIEFNCIWAKEIGGTNNSQASSLAIIADDNGNCYITGTFVDTVLFDTISISNGSHQDVFIAKYDGSGNIQWVNQLHASTGSYPYSSSGTDIDLDNSGQVIVTGNFCGTSSFGNYILTSQSKDLFVARYNPNGVCSGAWQGTYCLPYSIDSDEEGQLYICGYFADFVSFDSISLIGTGLLDIFLAKLSTLTSLQPNRQAVDNTLIIYANPSEGKCNITIPEEYRNEKSLTLKIFDLSGKVIQQIPIEINQDKVRINISAEAKGIYNVIISNGKTSYAGKIIFN
jgi:hypothetical protein